MNVSLYQAAVAMNAQARWEEMITENLTAGTVPGYRKQDVPFASVAAGLNPTVAGFNNARFMIPAATATTNFREDELRPTRSPLDLAIEGPGFFEVQMPNDEHAV